MIDSYCSVFTNDSLIDWGNWQHFTGGSGSQDGWICCAWAKYNIFIPISECHATISPLQQSRRLVCVFTSVARLIFLIDVEKKSYFDENQLNRQFIGAMIMNKRLALAAIFFRIVCLPNSVSAQLTVAGPELSEWQVKKAIVYYYQSIGASAHLYNGSEYIGYDRKIKGDPFFKSSLPTSGSLLYDGIAYSNIPLQYDVCRDEVVISRYAQQFNIRLVSEKLSFFICQNHHFFRLVTDTVNKSGAAGGFYDQIYTGKIQVLAKRMKRIEETIVDQARNVQFLGDDRFFIVKQKQYYPVGSRRSVLQVFWNQKRAIKKYMRKNRIRFKKDLEGAIVKVTAYYDIL